MQFRPIPHDERHPSSSPFSTPSKDSPLHERSARMSVLQEVLAEMYRMEQESMARSPEAMTEEEEPFKGTELPSVGEETEEIEDEGVADIDGADYDTDLPHTMASQPDGLTLPYEGSMDQDDDGDFDDVDDARFIDSGWGDECLQDAEDIDFEFVYALHTFVATVEGQANATKGDTMVLLDDSNSYWWLVRVVKDSSIGYLPAEHIETPTERLARLNKHRNIDLSATMLGDQAEKTKNPLKSAMRRRKAKTVTFNSSHQYHDYSDFDYSSEEEDQETENLAQKQQRQDQQATVQQASDEPGEMDDETARVEPLKPRSQSADGARSDTPNQDTNGQDASSAAARAQGRTSEEIFETKSGDGPKKTSDGTVRDSFFKDDTVETKKITLTPNLLRDDTAPRSSGDSNKELRQRSSLDKLEKDNPFTKDDKKKKDRKEKEKKAGGFRSLFSRKDKKKGSIDEDDDSWGKRSLDADGQEKEHHEEETAATSPEKPTGPQRNPSKLRKQQPRTEPAVNTSAAGAQSNGSGMDLASFLATEGKPNNVANAPPTSMRIVDPYEDLNSSPESSPQKPSQDRSTDASRRGQPPPTMSFRPAQVQKSGSQSRPQEVSQARVRAVLDGSDSEDDAEVAATTAPAPARPAPVPQEAQRQQSFRPQLPGAFPDSYMSAQSNQSASSDVTERGIPVNLMHSQQEQQRHDQQQQQQERLSESPVQISPVPSNNPPALMVDTSSQEEDHSSDRDTPSPELVEREDGDMHGQQDSMTTTTSAATEPVWNDASLRAFFDSGSDIRDMLVVVYDKTDVVPAGPEHPVAGTLFKEQNAKLAEITTQLDNMLGDWLARKQRLRGTV
ncbi:hypothetical protein DL546_006592 [Coniochaeta pulveracea]|uniref:SH3 domain-containing protein n=1 Tax=Coniochaeta pulveracea TaxID=177199 RepID=A0A420Y8W2_9PEZI|nr:hypothetical protein DL546_006592 [Coniochaeta pulveracea]